ncbi:hypothetical protein Baya_11760 [Bagarius yarrelli]|uniref:Uncharacterized protein n=1 Tax=Bagarius yarrelli TaxID=175774 RepID=A0A556V1N5_BAGYA|nr:hypothetical protein Baya_11760 [Bagarius yarrelli]
MRKNTEAEERTGRYRERKIQKLRQELRNQGERYWKERERKIQKLRNREEKVRKDTGAEEPGKKKIQDTGAEELGEKRNIQELRKLGTGEKKDTGAEGELGEKDTGAGELEGKYRS